MMGVMGGMGRISKRESGRDCRSPKACAFALSRGAMRVWYHCTFVKIPFVKTSMFVLGPGVRTSIFVVMPMEAPTA